VDFPIKHGDYGHRNSGFSHFFNGDFPVRYVKLPEGKSRHLNSQLEMSVPWLFSHLGWHLRLRLERLELWTLQGQIAEALYQLPLLLTWSYGGMVSNQPLNMRFNDIF